MLRWQLARAKPCTLQSYVFLAHYTCHMVCGRPAAIAQRTQCRSHAGMQPGWPSCQLGCAPTVCKHAVASSPSKGCAVWQGLHHLTSQVQGMLPSAPQQAGARGARHMQSPHTASSRAGQFQSLAWLEGEKWGLMHALAQHCPASTCQLRRVAHRCKHLRFPCRDEDWRCTSGAVQRRAKMHRLGPPRPGGPAVVPGGQPGPSRDWLPCTVRRVHMAARCACHGNRQSSPSLVAAAAAAVAAADTC